MKELNNLKDLFDDLRYYFENECFEPAVKPLKKLDNKNLLLKQELLKFLEANNYFGLSSKRAERMVDIYIKVYK